jgi:hypothetical protein
LLLLEERSRKTTHHFGLMRECQDLRKDCLEIMFVLWQGHLLAVGTMHSFSGSERSEFGCMAVVQEAAGKA